MKWTNFIVGLIKVVIGVLITLSALYGYHFEFSNELTFISNFVTGIFIAVDGLILVIFRKPLPTFLYLLLLPAMLTDFASTVLTILHIKRFNLRKMFLFMHAINPIVVILVYLFLTPKEETNKKRNLLKILLAPLLTMCYWLYDYIRFLRVGKLMYGLVPTNDLTFIVAMLIALAYYALVILLLFGLFKLKLFIQNKVTLIKDTNSKQITTN